MALKKLVSIAHEISSVRVAADPSFAEKTYEVSLKIPTPNRKVLLSLLQRSLEAALGLRTRTEVRDSDVLVLITPREKKPVLRPAEKAMPILSDVGQIVSRGTSLEYFCRVLEDRLGKIVLDATGIQGWYDISVFWNRDDPDSAIPAIQEQLGLEIKTERRPIELLIFETEN
jgi:uncharacterized protein (TIGR03435 family)